MVEKIVRRDKNGVEYRDIMKDTNGKPIVLRDAMEYQVHVDKKRQVAYIYYVVVPKPIEEHLDDHLSLALAFEQVRWDDNVRVVVYAGRDDGSGWFGIGPAGGAQADSVAELSEKNLSEKVVARSHEFQFKEAVGISESLRGPWSTTQGVERLWQVLAFLEKPVIAKWTGHAVGYAAAAIFGCDIIIADENATMFDAHLTRGLGDLRNSRSAGDGAMAFMPLYLSPAKLKEYLLLGQTWTGRRMADEGAINYALPADELDAKVEYFIQEFLDRPHAPLARTKRGLNKPMIEQMNLAADYGFMAELVDVHENCGFHGKRSLTLRPNDPMNNGFNSYLAGVSDSIVGPSLDDELDKGDDVAT